MAKRVPKPTASSTEKMTAPGHRGTKGVEGPVDVNLPRMKPKLAVCIPVPSTTMPSLQPVWVIGLINLVTTTMQMYQVTVIFDDLQGYGNSRNNLVHRALKEADADLVFFLDSDVLLDPDAILHLAAQNRGIASALYYTKRGDPAGPVVYNFVDNKGVQLEVIPDVPVIDADAVGLGACLIQKWVFAALADKVPDIIPEYGLTFRMKRLGSDKVTYNFFSTYVSPDGQLTGEDIFFFSLLKAFTEIRPVVVRNVPTRHMGTGMSYWDGKEHGVKLL